MLRREQIVLDGVSQHPHEQEAINWIKQNLPSSESIRAWFLVDLVESSGRRYEVDALILGPNALYLVEIKSHPAIVRGDAVDWTLTFESGPTRVMENPRRVTDNKSRVLASMLDRVMDRKRRPHVETLIFLSHEKARLELHPSGAANVVGRGKFVDAITKGDVPDGNPRLREFSVNKPMLNETIAALKKLGIRKSEADLRINDIRLGKVIEEGAGYQDYLAEHLRLKQNRRVRAYLVPQSPTQERRDQLRRAAEREARILTELSDHRGVMRLLEFVGDGPLAGPCLVFDHLDDAVPLDQFVRLNPTLTFSERLDILFQIADALGFCHGKHVVHRALHPGSVLVRRTADGRGFDLRLYNFAEAAQAGGISGTSHLTAFGNSPALVYRAPEVLEDPTKATTASDVFSLGSIAWFLFVGRNPGADLADRKRYFVDGKLSLLSVRDDAALAPVGQPLDGTTRTDLDAAIGLATDVNVVNRCSDVFEWRGFLEDVITAPATEPESIEPNEEPDIDPLNARKDAVLLGDYRVLKVLGAGATARALRVKHDERTYALKVALASEYEDRLRAEARTLERVRSERIVALEAELTLGKRYCLLLTDAGDTLADVLAREGPVGLDYARRWGDDLLRALDTLEEAGIGHRDIKPSNLGVTPCDAKKSRHLFLFDFSLSGLDSREILMGTPAYRDPFLTTRRAWDAAADRYAAAATLYEMLTGARVDWGSGPVAVTASEREASIEAERFDASVRDRLLAFFRKAFAREVTERHDQAESMRTEWLACFMAPAVPARSTNTDREPIAIALDAVRPETPIEALPLSPRARNALDRAGVMTARDLTRLPSNQLSAVRGVGRDTAKEIADLRAQLVARHLDAGDGDPPFFPAYRGADARVDHLDEISAAPSFALDAAGLERLSLIAAAPRRRIERILAAHPGELESVARVLDARNREATDTTTPTTIEAWLDRLVPPRKGTREKYLAYARQVLGLDPVGDVFVEDAASVARALGMTPQNIYIAWGKAREYWLARPSLPALHQLATAVVESLGGVARVDRAADALEQMLPHDPGSSDQDASGRAARALVRIAGDTADGLVIARIHDQPWIAVERERLSATRALGDVADELARREPLPSTEEVRDRLAEPIARSPMAALPFERIVAIAAHASKAAVPSARLELYPRGMAAARAVKLAAGAFGARGLAPEQIRSVVAARYPEAEMVPERPALDALLEPLGYEWRENGGEIGYRRKGIEATTHRTDAPSTRKPTAHTPRRAAVRAPEDQASEEFDVALRVAVERRDYRVLEVSASYARSAADEIARKLTVDVVSIDRELIHTAKRLAQEAGISHDLIVQTDAAGPSGEEWNALRNLMEDAARQLVERLERSTAVLLLKDPGILARYQLATFLPRMLEATQRDHGPGVLLVLPVFSDVGPAPIDGFPATLPVPTTSNAQRLRAPNGWVINAHRAAST